jgi:prepilin-type N-terminal cleavage/methylation domain-containing protein
MVNTKNKLHIHRTLFTAFYSRGFTLVELIVTVGIFAVITSTLLARNSKFNDETLLQNAAYEVALSIRQAQNYGINVQGQSGEFDKAYGVHFLKDSSSYVLFRDLDDPPDNIYSGEKEKLEEFKLGRGYSIARICKYSGLEDPCRNSLSGDKEGVSVVFRRPEPEAIITPSSDGKPQLSIDSVAIELVSPRAGSRFIVVQQTGQIGVVRASGKEGGGGSIELPFGG